MRQQTAAIISRVELKRDGWISNPTLLRLEFKQVRCGRTVVLVFTKLSEVSWLIVSKVSEVVKSWCGVRKLGTLRIVLSRLTERTKLETFALILASRTLHQNVVVGDFPSKKNIKQFLFGAPPPKKKQSFDRILNVPAPYCEAS